MNKVSAGVTAPESHDERLETLVRRRTDELSGLASHLQRKHEDANRRLARELHDELGSLLTAAKLDITFVKSKCAKSAPELVTKCDRIASMIDQAAALKRRIIDQLRPSTLDMLGLGPALRELVDNFAGDTGIAATIDVDDNKTPSGEPALAIYRVIESALEHIRENAHASNVRVSVGSTPASITLQVADDGRGGDGAGAAPAIAVAAIRQRISALGGSVSFERADNGSVMDATLPLDNAHVVRDE